MPLGVLGPPGARVYPRVLQIAIKSGAQVCCATMVLYDIRDAHPLYLLYISVRAGGSPGGRFWRQEGGVNFGPECDFSALGGVARMPQGDF